MTESQLQMIFSKLDWDCSPKDQEDGRKMAEETGEILPFFQPQSETFGENVWSNCAMIIASKSDDELKPYIESMLDWLRDMNRAGASQIMERLNNFSDRDELSKIITPIRDRALADKDSVWAGNLSRLLMNLANTGAASIPPLYPRGRIDFQSDPRMLMVYAGPEAMSSGGLLRKAEESATGTYFCEACGWQTDTPAKFCSNCGAIMKENK